MTLQIHINSHDLVALENTITMAKVGLEHRQNEDTGIFLDAIDRAEQLAARMRHALSVEAVIDDDLDVETDPDVVGSIQARPDPRGWPIYSVIAQHAADRARARRHPVKLESSHRTLEGAERMRDLMQAEQPDELFVVHVMYDFRPPGPHIPE